MTAKTSDWRQYATPEAQQAFADAQARLDDLEVQPDGTITTHGVDGEYTAAMRAEDERFTDWYDANVLASAQYEHERLRQIDEFNRAFPEPPNNSRIEWEGEGGTLRAAFRQDLPEHEGGSWWVYGSDNRWTWHQFVQEFRLPVGLADVAFLVEKTED